jgi:hypothetical protein
MKKLLPLLFLGISLASCSKKGNDPAPTPAVAPSLIGTWSVTSVKIVRHLDQVNGGITTTDTETFAPNSSNLTFTTDNKMIQTVDKSVSPTGVGYAITTLYTYGNGIIVSIKNNKTVTYKVETLTDKLLVLSQTENSPTSIDDYTITLTR